jgi:hypothetical protein
MVILYLIYSYFTLVLYGFPHVQISQVFISLLCHPYLPATFSVLRPWLFSSDSSPCYSMKPALGKNVRPYQKKTKSKKGWGCDSSDRVPALQVPALQVLVQNPVLPQKINEWIKRMRCWNILQSLVRNWSRWWETTEQRKKMKTVLHKPRNVLRSCFSWGIDEKGKM